MKRDVGDVRGWRAAYGHIVVYMSCERGRAGTQRQARRAQGRQGSSAADMQIDESPWERPKVGVYVKCDGLGEQAVYSHGQM